MAKFHPQHFNVCFDLDMKHRCKTSVSNSGFTLIELLITLAVMIVLISAFAPSYSNVIESNRETKIQSELEDLFNMSRHEAVTQNKVMYLHFVGLPQNTKVTTDWCVLLTTSSTTPLCDASVVFSIQSGHHQKITMERTYPETYIKFNEVNGKPILSHLDPAGRQSVIKFYANAADVLEFKSNFWGRAEFL
ncbi:pilus assembly FimT family protein [Vibrio nigripulchritudo]|uniref:pilus assembly FimT family protein n=1 Tax=Vibrio nigripulchritudo TaxID=28173 RepID=UPI00190D22D3|nr:GspH/FimT family pseudopilin [Vibrio nigripulchritudo]